MLKQHPAECTRGINHSLIEEKRMRLFHLLLTNYKLNDFSLCYKDWLESILKYSGYIFSSSLPWNYFSSHYTCSPRQWIDMT